MFGWFWFRYLTALINSEELFDRVTGLSSLSKKIQVKSFVDVINKGNNLSYAVVFKDPEYWSSCGSNPRH